MNTNDLDLPRLISDLERLTEKLRRLDRRPRPIQALIVETLEAFGTVSAYRLQKVTRRSRVTVYAGLRALLAAGRIERAREGYRLTEPGSMNPEPERVEVDLDASSAVEGVCPVDPLPAGGAE